MSSFEIKLSYFNIGALTEVARVAFKVGGVAFEDERVRFAEFQSDFKSTLPYGQFPLLTVNGTKIVQSRAIATFAASVSGLIPSDPIKAGLVNEVFYASEEIRDAFHPSYTFQLQDGTPEKEAKKQELMTTIFPAKLSNLEKRVKEIGADGYAVGDSITFADVGIFVHLGWLINEITPTTKGLPTDDILEGYPALKAIRATVAANPAVAAYYAEAPNGQLPGIPFP